MYIKGRFTSLNAYILANRGNKYRANKLKQQNQAMVKYQIPRGTKFECPCKIKFVFHIKDKRTDPDNISATGHKFALDALVQQGVIPNDSFRYIRGFVDEFVVDDEWGVEIMRMEVE